MVLFPKRDGRKNATTAMAKQVRNDWMAGETGLNKGATDKKWGP